MNPKYSARLVPELEVGLRDSGLLTSLVTLDSPRFSAYLKKPANLLHDGWTFVEGQGEGAFYRLGTEDGARQELTICRATCQAVLTTYQPRLGRQQRMVYSLLGKDVLENVVEHDLGSYTTQHAFLFLTRREGRLSRRVVEAESAAA